MTTSSPESGPRRSWAYRIPLRLVAGLVRRPALWSLVVIGATVAAFLVGMDVPIRSDLEDLFPDDSPSVVRATQAREVLGNRAELLVLVGSDDPQLNRRAATELAETIAAHSDLIGRVEVRRDVSFFEDNALLYLSLETLRDLRQRVIDAIAAAVREELESDFVLEPGERDPDTPGSAAGRAERERLPDEAELRERYLAGELTPRFETPDGDVVAIKVHPTFPPSRADLTALLNQRVAAAIADVSARYPGTGLTAATEGEYAHVTRAIGQIQSEATKAFLLALAGIAAMLLLFFRRLRALTVTLLSLVAATTWTFFVARVTIGHLNLITATIFSVVIGLGIDFVVHATSRIDEEMARGTPLSRAMPLSLARLGPAMSWAALAQMATFAALMVFEFRGFSQFGLIAGVGVMLCLASAYLVLPPAEALLDKARRRPTPAARPRAHRAPATPSTRRRWGVLATVALGALVTLAATALPDLGFEADLRQLKMDQADEQVSLRRKWKRDAAPEGTGPALIITEGLAETRRVHRALAARALDDPWIDKVSSIYSFVPDDQPQKLEVIRDTRRRLELKLAALEGQDLADAKRLLRHLAPREFGPNDLPDWLKRQFRDSSGRLGRYVLLYVPGTKSDGRRVLEIQQALGTVTVDGTSHTTIASWYILGDAMRIVMSEGPLAVGLAGLIILLFLIVDLRRVADVVTVFVPLCCGFVVFLGVLAVSGISLNLFNIIVLPTIFGIGVDTALHLVHRLNEGAPLGKVMRTTGRAAAISTATDSVGFLALTLVANEGLRSIGWVAVIGIASTYLCTVAMIGAIVWAGWKPEVRHA